MTKTISVNIKGTNGYQGEFEADNGQNFKIGDVVIIKGHHDNNGNEWNTADHYDKSWDSALNGNRPSYSSGNITSYIVGKYVVSRVFNHKIWVK